MTKGLVASKEFLTPLLRTSRQPKEDIEQRSFFASNIAIIIFVVLYSFIVEGIFRTNTKGIITVSMFTLLSVSSFLVLCRFMLRVNYEWLKSIEFGNRPWELMNEWTMMVMVMVQVMVDMNTRSELPPFPKIAPMLFLCLWGPSMPTNSRSLRPCHARSMTWLRAVCNCGSSVSNSRPSLIGDDAARNSNDINL